MPTMAFCADCAGKGYLPTPRQQEDCAACGGSGNKVVDEDPPKDGRYR